MVGGAVVGGDVVMAGSVGGLDVDVADVLVVLLAAS